MAEIAQHRVAAEHGEVGQDMTTQALDASKNGVVDMIYSPDDGGYYLHQYDFKKKRDRTSKVYADYETLRRLYRAKQVKWDKWT